MAMLSDKEIKKRYKPQFFADPDKYFPTSVLKAEGFHRGICSNKECGRPFWSTNKERTVCGDPSCVGGFSFIGNTPAKHTMDYIEVWQKFAEMFKKKGYTPIHRYPVVARWNPTMEYTNASIAAFQPYVVNGEMDPPANPLVIPQFSIRFVDIDNVGITGSHNTCFVMIGQHAFVRKEDWNQACYFKDIYDWAIEGLGLPKEELVIHEDAWAGGGNLGCCMEFFSRGLELFNQVYMMYEQTGDEKNPIRELNKKVLDMGLGMERNAWFSQGRGTQYDANFPPVMKKLRAITQVAYDEALMAKFIPLAPKLNADEVEDIDKAWQEVAHAIGMEATDLKARILPMQALYSIAEHSRTLLITLNDGALPSNVGGGYNLRLILRRALNFIESYGWQLELNDVIDWHAAYLKPIFPELSENLDEIHKIMDVEKQKYLATREKAKSIIARLEAKDITTEKLIALYDSQGIHPREIKEVMEKKGVPIRIPDNFYGLVAEKHEEDKGGNVAQTTRDVHLDLQGVAETEILYWGDPFIVEFDAVVLKQEGKHLILDRSVFYPTSGGQIHDLGTIAGIKVDDVFKQGKHIIHVLAENHAFAHGQIVHGHVDIQRRRQLAQHHTGTHILNGACKAVLGNHIWQAGAAKFLDRARLDITHYEALTADQIERIEQRANELIQSNRPIEKMLMPRNLAEAKFGTTIYQGGAVPGKVLRIVNIEGFDAEACGGTHCNLTGEVELLKIIKVQKIQDGILRVEFAAGTAAKTLMLGEMDAAKKISAMLGCEPNQVPGRVEELFAKWKSIVKKGKKESAVLTSTKTHEGKDIIEAACAILRTQPEHLEKTIQRFLDEIETALSN